ncbi:hypothetical protein ACFLZ1_05075 [Patescibacteria group bacterium]
MLVRFKPLALRMVKDYRKRKSRLTKLEEKKSIKQAFLFVVLTIVLVIALISLGIPALIKFVVFIGDLKSTDLKPVAEDSLSPPIPVLQPVPEATYSGQLNLKGYTEEGAIIKLVIGGITIKEVIAEKDGTFIFDAVKLKEGENEIKTKAVDTAGNESSFSKTITIIFDNEPPELNVTAPEEGKEFFDKEKSIKVEGESDSNITVYVNGRLTSTNSEGMFSLHLELKDGENEIKVKAIDKAGNETEATIKVSYTP